MVRRTYVLVGGALALCVVAGLLPYFDGGIVDISASGPRAVREYAPINDPVVAGPPGFVSRTLEEAKHRFERFADQTPPEPPRFRSNFEGRVFELPPPSQKSWFQPFFEVAGLTFVGTAEPGSLVTLSSARGVVMSDARADANDRWEIKEFARGSIVEFFVSPVLTVTATATDAVGNVSAPSSIQVTTRPASSPAP